jgi:prolyl oligopeptidase
MFDKKITTYQDLAAAAEEVVKEGWTKPSLIISTGTSNGGLTVSATALLFPQDFGLVIPIAGVDDFLGKERLDPANQGWDEEYGDATDPNMLPSMTAVSPVENARNLGSQHFLIVDGLSDTRVNHVHSLKLQAAIEELGGSAGWSELASFQAAGHALASYPYQNTISWHVNSLIWTAIFNQAGWKW